MAEVINLTEYINKKKEKEVKDLSRKLADIIEDLDIKEEFKMYTHEPEDYIYGLPSIYTMYPPNNMAAVQTLSDITDILTTLTISLDSMGYIEWANQISNVVGEMFASGSFKEG